MNAARICINLVLITTIGIRFIIIDSLNIDFHNRRIAIYNLIYIDLDLLNSISRRKKKLAANRSYQLSVIIAHNYLIGCIRWIFIVTTGLSWERVRWHRDRRDPLVAIDRSCSRSLTSITTDSLEHTDRWGNVTVATHGPRDYPTKYEVL